MSYLFSKRLWQLKEPEGRESSLKNRNWCFKTMHLKHIVSKPRTVLVTIQGVTVFSFKLVA